MKTIKSMIISGLMAISLLSILPSCRRPADQMWDDAKTRSRQLSRSLKSLKGPVCDSRQVGSRDEFMGWQGQPCGSEGVYECEFIGFANGDECREVAMADLNARQPLEAPGDPGSTLPGIDAFRSPSQLVGMDAIFCNVNFEYNSNLIKGDANVDALNNIASYMRSHPNLYIFVEGHCDERGPEAYNLALGARRSNSVRAMLIDLGVDGERIFTISYGKERPLVYGSSERTWAQNRRAEFKIYQR